MLWELQVASLDAVSPARASYCDRDLVLPVRVYLKIGSIGGSFTMRLSGRDFGRARRGQEHRSISGRPESELGSQDLGVHGLGRGAARKAGCRHSPAHSLRDSRPPHLETRIGAASRATRVVIPLTI